MLAHPNVRVSTLYPALIGRRSVRLGEEGRRVLAVRRVPVGIDTQGPARRPPNTALHRTPPVIALCEVGWLCSSGVAGERPRWAAGPKAASFS